MTMRFSERIYIRQIDWESILGSFEGDLAGITATFQDVFESILNLLTGKRVRSEYAPWLSASLRNLMKECNRTKRISEGQPEMWPTHKQ